MRSRDLGRGLIGLVVSVLALDVFVLSFFPWWYGTPTTLENFVGLLAILPTAWFLWAAPELDAPPWLPSLVKTGAGIVAASAVLMALAMAAGLHWSAMPLFFLGFLGVLVVGIGFLAAILKETIPSLAATVDRLETLRLFAWSSKLAAWGLGLLALLALWGGVLDLPVRRTGQILATVGIALVLGALALLSWGVLDLAYHGLSGPGDGSDAAPGVLAEA